MITIKLPKEIKTWEEGKVYLKLLVDNNYSYHPEDDATDIQWSLPEEKIPTQEEMKQMNVLMRQIYALPEFKDYPNIDYCPCGYLLDLDLCKPRAILKLVNPGKGEAPLRYVITNYNDVTRKVYAKCINSGMTIAPEELMHINELCNENY